MAALRDDGHTICDASLKLEILNPKSEIRNFLTEDGTIQYSGECGPNNVVDVPDYFAFYQIDEVGIYQMKLINLDNGHQITDSFEVRDWVPFDVERIGPTRVYPPAIYKMTLRIKVNQDFEGEIVEKVPDSFKISNQELRIENKELSSINDSSFVIQEQGNGEKSLIWQDVSLSQGDELEIRYTFDVPDISPYLYLLGPLNFQEFQVSSFKFQEIRQWQIASDADFIYGTAREFNADAVARLGSALLSSTTSKFVICYTDGSAGQCRIGEASTALILFGEMR